MTTKILIDNEFPTISGFSRVWVVYSTERTNNLLEWISTKAGYCDIETRDESPAWPEMAIN